VKRPAMAGDPPVTERSGKPYLVQGGMEAMGQTVFLSPKLPAA